MSKRVSKEAQIVSWFENEPISVVKAVLGIVQGKVKERLAGVGIATTPKALRKKRSPRKSATAVPANAGSTTTIGGTANVGHVS